MNDKETLKRRTEKAKQTITTEMIWLALVIVVGLIFSQLCGAILIPINTSCKIISILISSAIGIYIGLRIRQAEILIRREMNAVWDEIDFMYCRTETTLEDILLAAKKAQSKEWLISFIGERKRERAIDDLATEKLEEKEEEHIPRID